MVKGLASYAFSRTSGCAVPSPTSASIALALTGMPALLQWRLVGWVQVRSGSDQHLGSRPHRCLHLLGFG